MNPTTVAATLAAIAFFGAAGYELQAAMSSPPTLMSSVDRDHAWGAIDHATEDALARCGAEPRSSRDLCRARARTHDRIEKAELDARYYGTVQAQQNAEDVRAHARFELARAECEARGTDRSGCLTDARNQQAKALAVAKVASR